MLTDLSGKFGNYDYHELASARSRQYFGDVLIQVRTDKSEKPASDPSPARGPRHQSGCRQTAFNSRQVNLPSAHTDLHLASHSREDESFLESVPINRTNRLVRLILDDDDTKFQVVAKEFLDLTEAQFQHVLDKAAAILREKEIDSAPYMSGCNLLAIGLAVALAMYFASFNLTGLIPFDGATSLIVLGICQYLIAGFGSTGMMYANGCIDAAVALKSKGKKILELRNQFQEFCTSVREIGLRRACCPESSCSVSRESIIRFSTYAGLTGAVVVGGGLVGIAPYLDALASGFGSNGFWGNIVEMTSGNPLSQQAQDTLWWIHFVGTYACELGVPLVFLASIFAGLKHDFMEFCHGARQRNERVQDTVHNLRALLARLIQDGNHEEFVEGLMHQKHITSPELMLMDCIDKAGLDVKTLHARGITPDKLHEHDLDEESLTALCEDARQTMAELPDREISPAEALDLVNSLRSDVSFRRKVLNGLKLGDATYDDRWVRFIGGARTIVRLGLGWLSMNSLSGTFASPMIVSHYRNEAGIAQNVTLTCALFANKTITPFDAVTFHAGVISYASQGISLSDAEVSTLDAGWRAAMMIYSGVTAGTRLFPRLNAETACAGIKEGLKATWKEIIATVAGSSGALMYLYIAHQSGGKNDVAVMLSECPYLSDVPDSPIVYEYRGSNYASVACLAAILPTASISAWYNFLDKVEITMAAKKRIKARIAAARQQDAEGRPGPSCSMASAAVGRRLAGISTPLSLSNLHLKDQPSANSPQFTAIQSPDDTSDDTSSAARASLSGQKLSGQKLSGQELSGQELQEVDSQMWRRVTRFMDESNEEPDYDTCGHPECNHDEDSTRMFPRRKVV